MTSTLSPAQTQQQFQKTNKGERKLQDFINRLETLNVEVVPIDQIRPNTWNPNRHTEEDFELLVTSIQEDGFTLPVLITTDDVIIDGEHRWRACMTLGFTEIHVVRSPMSEEQAKLSTIRHNTARGSHDIDLENAVLRDLERMGALDLAKKSLMMSDDEISARLSDVPSPEQLAGEEYTTAWLPSLTTQEETDRIIAHRQSTVMNQTEDSQGAPLDVGMTAAAINAQYKILERQINADTEKERTDVYKESKSEVFRLLLTFDGSDAELVRTSLGIQSPAERLVKMCELEWVILWPDHPLPTLEEDDE